MSNRELHPAVMEELYVQAHKKDSQRIGKMIADGLSENQKTLGIDKHGNFNIGGKTYTQNPSGKV